MPAKTKAKTKLKPKVKAKPAVARKTVKPTVKRVAVQAATKIQPAIETKIETKPEPIKEERITMASLELTIPAVWADHHVTAVKRLLSPIAGVEEVIASSAFKAVVIEYDAKKTSEAALVKALTDAGYAPGELEIVGRRPDGRFDPAWDTNGVRVVTTNQVDNQLSGEFRKY